MTAPEPLSAIANEGTLTAPIPAIQLAGVQKAYGGWRKQKSALNGVSLRVNRGECYGLAGPNGAGKTTLIKVMLGLVAPDEGEVRVFGQHPEQPDVRRRIGFVPEAAEMPNGATPLQLVGRWAQLRGLERKTTQEQGEQQLVRLGMKELLKRPVNRLSKGERQRTLLALALLGAPDLLILDEPTDGLDPLGRALMRRVIEEECAAGRTVFLNSHLLSETERICSRVGILHRGQLVREEALDRGRSLQEQGATTLRVQASLPPELITDLKLRPTSETEARYRLEHASLAELNDTIDRLRASGALLIEVRRLQADLEETLATVAASVETQPAAVSAEPVVDSEPLRVPVGRSFRAVFRVAREIASDLWTRRILHVGLAGAVLVLGLLIYISQEELAQGLAAMSRMLVRSKDVNDIVAAAKYVGGIAAGAAHWFLFLGATFLSALFAPPILEGRRAILLQSQPVSRGDIATGIFVAVFLVSTTVFVFFDALFFGALRYLGAETSPLFMVTPLVTALAFASLYAGTLAATYIFPSGLFAGFFGTSQLVLFSVLNSLPQSQLGKAEGVRGFLLALIPKVTDVGFAAIKLGGGERPFMFPLVSTAVYTVAMLLVLQLIARKSER